MARPAVGAVVPVVAVLAVLLTGCTGYAVPDDVATYQPEGPGGADALLEGILVREDGCTYVDDPVSGVRWLPVFPAGHVTWADDRLIVDNLSYAVGDSVGFGGGVYGSGGAPGIDVPEACDSSPERWQVS